MKFKDDNEAKQAGLLALDPEEGTSLSPVGELARVVAENGHRLGVGLLSQLAKVFTAKDHGQMSSALARAVGITAEGISQAEQSQEGSSVRRYRVRSKAEMARTAYEHASVPRPRVGSPTGNAALDDAIGGYRRGHVTVLGASTNWGKSSFAVMATDAAQEVGKRVLLVSGEDTEELYGRRFMAKAARINALKLRDGNVSGPELSRLISIANEANDEPFFLNGIGKSAEYLAAAVAAICEECDKDLVIVDYLQAFTCAKKCQDRRNEITHIARLFTDAIKGGKAAGLIFSQLKRIEGSARPTKNDLKESGDIENMAEHVLIGWHTKGNDGQLHRFASVDKNKDGPVLDATIELPFDQVTASFRQETPRLDRSEGYDAQYN